ncbi:hypothetical protein LTR33_015071 [Friedmanniomyces endolithicus]|nr:hypothetical protein LTR33_015071 [Friedmanniomyces endolithicus]
MLRLAWRSLRYHKVQRLRKQAAQQEAARNLEAAAQATRREQQRTRIGLLAEKQQRQQHELFVEEKAKWRRKSQAQAEQQRKEHKIRCHEAAEQQRKADLRRMYVQWQTSCDKIFSDPATATSIPQPP